MVWACRFLMLVTFALFWGGLTFYTGFVVDISHDVLGDPMVGGLITQRATRLLQTLGGITLVLMLCNAGDVARTSKGWAAVLGGCTILLGCAIVGLVIVHGHLDAVIDADRAEITDRDAFRVGHRRYNQLTTVEWLASLSYLAITVCAWRHVDAAKSLLPTNVDSD